MKKFLATVFFCAFFCLIAIAPINVFAAEAPLQTVKIAQWGKEKIFLYLPLYVAMEEGIFKKHGIDAQLVFAGNDDQVFATVISGAADFGLGDPVFTAIAKEKGGPGKVVALLITRLGFSGYTNKPEIKEINAAEQLNMLRLSSFPEPSTTYTLLSGIKRDKAPGLDIVQMAFGSQLSALEAGKVDIAVDFEPAVSIAEDKGYRIVFDLEKYTDPQAITGITTTESKIKQDPAMVQKVVDSLQEAMTLLHKDPAAALRVAKKVNPALKDSVVKAALNRMMAKGMYPDSVVLKDDLWQRSLKTRLDSGELKKAQATDVSVDNSFAQKAQK